MIDIGLLKIAIKKLFCDFYDSEVFEILSGLLFIIVIGLIAIFPCFLMGYFENSKFLALYITYPIILIIYKIYINYKEADKYYRN